MTWTRNEAPSVLTVVTAPVVSLVIVTATGRRRSKFYIMRILRLEKFLMAEEFRSLASARPDVTGTLFSIPE